jgi:hypothetical protein
MATAEAEGTRRFEQENKELTRANTILGSLQRVSPTGSNVAVLYRRQP